MIIWINGGFGAGKTAMSLRRHHAETLIVETGQRDLSQSEPNMRVQSDVVDYTRFCTAISSAVRGDVEASFRSTRWR